MLEDYPTLAEHLEINTHSIPDFFCLLKARELLDYGLSDAVDYEEVYGRWDMEMCDVMKAFPTWEECTNVYNARAERNETEDRKRSCACM